MSRLGLMMIVKDEAHVIETCLRSVRGYIDWWVVVDTGSTDGTQDVVRRVMADLPGDLVERPWVDFGHNRQEALDLARSSPHRGDGDYACWLDADQHLTDVPTTPDELELDGYHLTVRYGDLAYERLVVVRLSRPWRWRDPIHEYLDLPGATLGRLSAPVVVAEHTGARSRDPDTYRKDAALIERVLAETPDNPRMQFYLGQSWRDAGELERALEAYRRRVDNPDGWDQERWYAAFQVAALMEQLDLPRAEVADAYLTAAQQCAWRAEPLVQLARIERERGRFEIALLYARPATRLALPTEDALFVDVGSYTWRAWDEVAIACYWTGRRTEGLDAARRALDVRPDDERLRANLDWLRQLPAG